MLGIFIVYALVAVLVVCFFAVSIGMCVGVAYGLAKVLWSWLRVGGPLPSFVICIVAVAAGRYTGEWSTATGLAALGVATMFGITIVRGVKAIRS